MNAISKRWLLVWVGLVTWLVAGCSKTVEAPAAPTAQEAPATAEAAAPGALAEKAAAEAGKAAPLIDGAVARTKVAAGAFLLDVRTPEEFAEGHVEGATNIPVQVLAERMAEVPKDREVVVYCRSGGRSARAAELLQQDGLRVFDLGGIGNWSASAAETAEAEPTKD